MEHPIPQNVTSFQFKLIGNMTIKQFAYLASGAILAWIFFILPFSSLIKLPMGFLSFVFGFTLAFIPIAGRPFDLMIYLFIKSLFAPNQYLFQKMGGQLFRFNIAPKHPLLQKEKLQSSEKLGLLLESIPKEPKNKLDEKEVAFFDSLSGLFDQTNNSVSPLPSQSPLPPQPTQAPLSPVSPPQTMIKKSPGVSFVSDVPNLVAGIVKDPRGNVLPNILVEIKDKEGSPVRAFKTNQGGQFACATPLLNGVYTLFFEDPEEKHKFAPIEITAQGEIMPPFEIRSIDQREELRRALFYGQGSKN